MNEEHPQQDETQPMPPAVAPGGDATLTDEEVNSKRILCGIMGIIFGGLGVHKFILGNNKPAIIMLVVWLVGMATSCFGGFLLSAAAGIIGLVEGIMYLTKSNDEFRREYIEGQKEWF